MKPFSDFLLRLIVLYHAANSSRRASKILYCFIISSGISTLFSNNILLNTDSYFTITKDGISCPESPTVITGDQSQSDINQLFENWKDQFGVKLDCAAVTSFKVAGEVVDLETLESPSACGGQIQVEMDVNSDCGSFSCESLFVVEELNHEMVISLPIVDFTCWQREDAPTYRALPPRTLQNILAFAIYSPCINIHELSLKIEETTPVIIGQEYNFQRIYSVYRNQDLATRAYEIFTITHDPVAPKLMGVPADMMLACGSPLPAWPMVTTRDADRDLTVHSSETVHFSPCGGRYYVRSWTATDHCGNSSEAAQRIYFEDMEPPWILVPADTTIDCSAEIPDPTYDAGDHGCSTFKVAFEEQKIQINACEFDLIRTWSVTDGCNLNTMKTQRIQVRDLMSLLKTSFGPSLKNNSRRSQMLKFDFAISNRSISDFEGANNYREAKDKLLNEVTADALNIDNIGIYPNPVSEMTTITFENPQDGYVNIAIFNPWGVELKKITRYVPKGAHHEYLNTGFLPQGIYILQLQIKKEITSGVLIKS